MNNTMEKLTVISRVRILETQRLWGEGIVKIGLLKDQKLKCKNFTNNFLNSFYSFEHGPVLFKPTKCSIQQFRQTKAQALSYFIAGEKKAYKEDYGFAIQPWVMVRFENSNFILEEKRAIAMGNYYFTDSKNNVIKTEYTFGYKLINDNLKIDLHHSSLPYNPYSTT